MMEEILNLLNSSNIEDIVLGIRIMEEKGLTTEIFKEYEDMNSIYSLHFKRKKANIDGRNGCIVLENSVFHLESNWISLTIKEKENVIIESDINLYNERDNAIA